MKRYTLYTLFFIGCMVVGFLLVEGLLRVIGVGYSTVPFVRIKFLPQYYTFNSKLLHKYYPSRPFSSSNDHFHVLFPVKKSPGTLRVFVLGGSTAQGFPYDPNLSFSKIIETALMHTGLYSNVEVINLGFSALSSYYVADMAPKLLSYQPDVLLIYSGQNEYYGTLSSLEKPWWMQKLYLALKEWRIFQLLFSFIETEKRHNDRSLMAEQFAKRRIPYDKQRDTLIANDFSRNIQKVIHLYRKHQIPVFLYDPVVNLIDMPPFGGENENEITTILRPYQVFFHRPKILAKKLHEDGFLTSLVNRFPKSAHALYLSGLAAMQEKRPFLDTLEKAKDYDTIPFRYRSEIREAIRSLTQRESTNPFFVFLPLRDEIIRRYGEHAFDSTIFIDHLHFNREGQYLLASLFCTHWLKYIQASEEYRTRLSVFFSQRSLIERSIFYHPYYDYQAEARIAGLLQEPPYSLMLFPYQKKKDLLSHPFVFSLPVELRSLLLSGEDVIQPYFSHLYTTTNLKEMAFLIDAISAVSPAHPQSHYNIAIFLSLTGSYSEEAANAWILAILLSHKTNQKILSNARAYFQLHKQENILREWRIQP